MTRYGCEIFLVFRYCDDVNAFKLFYSVLATKANYRFQNVPLWKAFSKSCGFSERFFPLYVHEKPIRNKMIAD